jgi:uncharacterized protein YndB with AHSA1/START domain
LDRTTVAVRLTTDEEVPMANAAKAALNRLQFSIDIAAPPEKVWQVLWDDSTFTNWTSVFAEGSYAVSDWKEGSKIHFIDPASRSGMSSIIEKKRPGEFMSFRHVGEISNGQEQPPAEWSGAHENYTLTRKAEGTTLHIDLEAADEHRKMFEEKFPQALQRVKNLSEAT